MPVYKVQGQIVAKRTVTRDNNEAVTCGSYGKIIRTSGQLDQCKLDVAVAPLAWLVVYDRTNLDLKCKFSVGGSAELNAMKPALDNIYGQSGRGNIKNHLRDLMNEVFLTEFSSISEYEDRMRCATYIIDTLSPTDPRPAKQIQT